MQLGLPRQKKKKKNHIVFQLAGVDPSNRRLQMDAIHQRDDAARRM